MKRITAVIRPEKLDDVKEALEAKGFFAMTISNVKGRGAQKGICLQFRGKKMLVDTIPKVQIDIVTEEPNVRPIVDIILKAGHTGKVGDGKIFVTPVEIIASVRSGEIIE